MACASSARVVGCWVLVAACGHVKFEPSPDAGVEGDPGGGPDGGLSAMIPCADVHLGSTLGRGVATGSTLTNRNRYQGCGGDGGDVTIGWVAPAAARYVIDLCDSDELWDSVLSVRDGNCI